jgi:serine/threonine protein kinase
MSESTADRDPLDRLAEEFAERLRRGEHPSINEFVERCPERADDIRELFEQIAVFERYKPAEDEAQASAPAHEPLGRGEIPDRLGDYRILRYLGEGGMGVVYEAVRESLHSHVALKVMHPQFRNRQSYLRRFRTEARSAARMHHTHIVSVFDYGVHDGVCYYAMQYIAGHALDKILDDIRHLRVQEQAGADRETAPLNSDAEDEPVPGEGEIRQGAAQCPAEVSMRTVSLALLSGQFATAAPGDECDNEHTASLAGVSAAPRETTEDQNKLKLSAKQLARGVDTTTTEGKAAEHSKGTVAPRQRPIEPSLTRLAASLARDLPADEAGPRDGESSSLGSATSSLAARSDTRYYREVARLGVEVADALAYAHKLGVLHRDIKPPNLILDMLGNIWITDFGLAKFEDGDDLSQTHDVVGTLRYMAPERFRGVSTAGCDLYALGATLYELVTLRPPFGSRDQLELIHQIEHEPPLPPRQVERAVPRDLETIILKALAKNPGDRFASAQEMGAELRRFVENRPIRSRPIPFYQRFARWCQRNPKLAAANIAAAVLTTVLAIGATVAAWTYRDQRNEIGDNLKRIEASEAGARRARTEAREELFKALLDRARLGRFTHQVGQRFKSLEALHQAADIGRELKLPRERFEPLRNEAIACMSLPDLEPVGRVIKRPQGTVCVAFDSTMTRYALRLRDGTIHVRRVDDDEEIARFITRGDREAGASLSPDGRYLATCDHPEDVVTVWDVDRRAIALNLPGLTRVEFSPDSRRIVVDREGKLLLVYDLASGQLLRRWRPAVPVGWSVFRPDGTQIAGVYYRTCQFLT